jgi:hypothetical protein
VMNSEGLSPLRRNERQNYRFFHPLVNTPISSDSFWKK